MTVYRHQGEAFHYDSSPTRWSVGPQLHWDIFSERRFGPLRAFDKDWLALYLGFQRRNEMLGLGLLGTIIVICLVVWLIRRV